MENKNIKNLKLLQFLTWAAWAAFGQFYTYYLMEIGYTSDEIGFALMWYYILGVVGQFVFGLLCDKMKTIKKMYLVSLLISNIFVIAFSFLTDSKVATYIVVAIIGFSWFPKSSLIDSWIIDSDGIDQNDYGKFRMWGSLGYALVASFLGIVLKTYGYNIMIITFVLLSTIEGIIAFGTDDVYVNHDAHEKIHPIELFKNKIYVMLIIFALLIGTGKFMIINFYPFIFDSVNGSEFKLGLAASMAAFVEIPLFMISSKIINKFKPIRILLVCAIIYLLRILLTWVAVTPTQLILIAIVQAMGFTYIMATGRILVANIAPPNLKTTAQGIFSAAFFSVSGIISSLTGGFLIYNVGMDAFYFVAALFVLLGIILMIVINVMRGKKV